MRTIGVAERRSRLWHRHHLATPSPDVVAVARDLVGLHSSDPATVFLSARARTAGFVPSDLERELYDRRTLVRVLAMRRTMFVVPTDLAPALDAACTRALAPRERARTLRIIEEQQLADDPAAWLDRLEADVVAALRRRGEATARELTEDVPDLGRRITFGEGTRWAGEMGMSTRLLFLLASEARIVRGRPLGGWTSSQYRWAPTDAWLGEGFESLDPRRARAELMRRWLAAFGPASFDDAKWWTGWTVRDTRAALADVDAVEVALGPDTAYLSAEDAAAEDEADGRSGGQDERGEGDDAGDGRVVLLPGLDPTVMGWKERSWFLPAGAAGALFDRNGNAGPTVWLGGRVVGGWAQLDTGEVVTELLEDLGAERRDRVDRAAAELSDWLADVRVTSRFRTPLERRLRG